MEPKMKLGLERAVSVLSVFILYFVGIQGACNSGNADEFTAIDPAKYDKNYSSITDFGKRPYGFQKSTWYYNNPGRDNPCLKVTNASNRRVEIMVEAVPQSRLCVKDQNSQLGCADSGTGQLFSCKPASSDTVALEFYCDKQCGEHDVQFWYRIVLGETPDQDPEDHWCDYRSHDDYPENLQQLPPGFDFPMDTTTPLSQAPRTSHQLTGLSIILCLCIIALVFT